MNAARNMKPVNKKLFTPFVLLVSIAVVFSLKHSAGLFDVEGDINLDSSGTIMHAMGGIGAHTYTNCLEAFEYHYKRGRRLFEVDFSLTSDSEIVACHNANLTLTKEEFLTKKIAGNYTPLSLDDVLRIMDKHDKVFIITDIKGEFNSIFSILANQVNSQNPLLWQRIIPQIYQEQDIKIVCSFYDFKKVIYTLYKTNTSDTAVLEFVLDHPSIRIVTMSISRFSERLTASLHGIGVKVFVHTLNNKKQIQKYLSNGADGIYTDYY